MIEIPGLSVKDVCNKLNVIECSVLQSYITADPEKVVETLHECIVEKTGDLLRR